MISLDEGAFFGEVGDEGEGKEGEENPANLQPYILLNRNTSFGLRIF